VETLGFVPRKYFQKSSHKIRKSVYSSTHALNVSAQNRKDSEMLASIFNAPAKRFILIMHTEASITTEVLRLTFSSKAEAKAEAKRRGLKAWNY